MPETFEYKVHVETEDGIPGMESGAEDYLNDVGADGYELDFFWIYPLARSPQGIACIYIMKKTDPGMGP